MFPKASRANILGVDSKKGWDVAWKLFESLVFVSLESLLYVMQIVGVGRILERFQKRSDWLCPTPVPKKSQSVSQRTTRECVGRPVFQPEKQCLGAT